MPHASRSIDVAAPPEEFLSVLLDYARYPEFIREVKSIRVDPQPDGAVRVTYKLDAKLMLVEYTLEHRQTGPRTVEWRLVRGDFFRANAGSWSLEPIDSGTRATYTIDLQLGTMPASLQTALRETGLPRLLDNFKARVEALWKRQRDG